MLNLIKKVKQYICGLWTNKPEVDKFVVDLEPRSDIFITKIIEYRG